MKGYFFIFLALFSSLFGADTLVVRYGATNVSKVENAIKGVLITPSGEVLYTDPLGPFGQYNMVIESPEAGTYQAYFEVLDIRSSRLCPIVGGINALLCSNPGSPILFSPKSSHIQAIAPGTPIQIGSISGPIATFQIAETN